MPFSKAWRNAIYPDYKDQGAYIDYKATKEILHRMKEDIANPSTPDELYDSLLKQKDRVYHWCTRKQAELLKVAEALDCATVSLQEDGAAIGNDRDVQDKRPVDGADNNIGSMHTLLNRKLSSHEARLFADSIVHELLRFVECRNLNTDTMEHILGRMYRYAVLGPTGDRWKNVYAQYDLYTLSVDEIFYYLSRVYDRVKQIEERISAKGKASMSTGAVGTQVFDRKSVKYWVHMQDLPFVIARIIPHLPLSTFKDTHAASVKLNKPFTLFSPVSSVYYDNNNFLFYHRRLERIEGSTLIRIRWYSDTYADDWNALSPDDNVFMEIKVHHEAWSGVRSNKRRFAVKERDADKFIHANLSLLPALDKLKAKGAGVKEQENFKSLATEILTKIHSYELKPVLRTQCGRAAFQRGADQTVRISIDTDLRMSAEDFGLSHHWRYTGGDSPVSHFPYAVVEVKLQFAENERMPPWIEELMGCRYMEGVPKFSKYAHGIATLYGHTPFISMVPYWMHQLDVDIRASTKPEESLWDPTVGLASGCLERVADRVIFGSRAAQTQTVGASEAQFLTRSDYARTYQKLLQSLAADAAVASPVAADTVSHTGVEAAASEGVMHVSPLRPPTVLSSRSSLVPKITTPVTPDPSLVVQYSVDRRHMAYTTFHLYPYAPTGVESLCFHPSQGRNAAAQVFYGKIPWQTGKRIKVPQKYDPKTLLTSERYMVKWMQLATQIGLLGIASIRFGNGLLLPRDVGHLAPLWRSKFHIVLGVTMVGMGLLTLLYAYVGFKARARRVYARRKIRYDDTVGPTWLTFFVITGFAVLTATHISVRYGPMLTGSDMF